MSEPIRIVLSAEQTRSIIDQAGEDRHEGRVFACVGPGSWTDAAGRLVLYLTPAKSTAAANDAVRVAMGQARAVKPRRSAKTAQINLNPVANQ